MTVLFWNCRGLAQPSTVRSLRAMLRQANLDCLCIVETKVSSTTGILARLGYPKSLEVPAVGLRSGIIFARRQGVEFDLVVMNQHVISVVLFGKPSFQPWALSFVHSP